MLASLVPPGSGAVPIIAGHGGRAYPPRSRAWGPPRERWAEATAIRRRAGQAPAYSGRDRASRARPRRHGGRRIGCGPCPLSRRAARGHLRARRRARSATPRRAWRSAGRSAPMPSPATSERERGFARAGLARRGRPRPGRGAGRAPSRSPATSSTRRPRTWGRPSWPAPPRSMAARTGARCRVIVGDALLRENYPTIHAVGRASTRAPRLVDLTWGDARAPKLTLVGKGVCFDSGGLDLKPASGMRMMKKDMGGAATLMGLAQAVMALKLPVRLRLLVPAVENSVSGNAFRPLDVHPHAQGHHRRGRQYRRRGPARPVRRARRGVPREPGAAARHGDLDRRRARGAGARSCRRSSPTTTRSPPTILRAGTAEGDPLWRLPLWTPYREMLKSPVADINNVSEWRLRRRHHRGALSRRVRAGRACPGRISTPMPGTPRPAPAGPKAARRWACARSSRWSSGASAGSDAPLRPRPRAGAARRGRRAAAPRHGVLFKHPSGARTKRVKLGFAWDLFLFAGLFGVPLFLRGLPDWGAAMLATVGRRSRRSAGSRPARCSCRRRSRSSPPSWASDLARLQGQRASPPAPAARAAGTPTTRATPPCGRRSSAGASRGGMRMNAVRCCVRARARRLRRPDRGGASRGADQDRVRQDCRQRGRFT